MQRNRLNLDFSIESAVDRSAFLKRYLEGEEFKKKPLTESEANTCASYLLYGKDEDGTSAVSRKEVLPDSKKKTWTNEQKITSLDYLLDEDKEEGIGLNETQILRPYQKHYKNVKEVFSRESALKAAPDYLKQDLIELFKQIDYTELILNYYELFIGKRDKEPREQLFEYLSEKEKEECKKIGESLTQFQYLKRKHLLVELRQEQYYIRDGFQNRILPDTIHKGMPIEDTEDFVFDVDCAVKPLGLIDGSEEQGLVFQDIENLYPKFFSESDLKKISHTYWYHKEMDTKLFFDFTNEDHVYALLCSYVDLKSEIRSDDFISTTKFLFPTLEFYIRNSNLSDAYKEILDLKIHHTRNTDIIKIVNQKYNKAYTDNYISTIFKQKIVNKITHTAALHEKIVSNLFFSEEFGECITCHRQLLLDTEFFTRKQKSKSGYSSRCKQCEREKRMAAK